METRADIASPIQPTTEVLPPDVTAELISTGAVKRLDSFEHIWHGRSGRGEEWVVDPFFNNHKAGNIYGGVMYATPYLTDATEFAHKVAGEESQAIVEELVPTNGNVVIEKNCSPELGAKLAITSLTIGVPIKSELEGQAAVQVRSSAKQALRPRRILLSDEDITRFAAATLPKGSDAREWQKAVQKYGEAYNSRTLIEVGQLDGASNIMLGRPKLRVQVEATTDSPATEETISFSQEYIAEVFRKAHIAGTKMNIQSVTVGRQLKDTLVIWDKESLQEKSRLAEKEVLQSKAFNRLEKSLAGFSSVPEGKLHDEIARMRNIIQDPYVSPTAVVEEARKTALGPHLELSAGVWEGYTIGEHTDAVLNMFERYYADKVPAAMVGFLRTALFMHDLGKPYAIAKGEKKNQAAYNVSFAQNLMEQMKYTPSEIGLVTDLIGEGSKIFSQYVRHNTGAIELQSFLESYAEKLFGEVTTERQQAAYVLLEIAYDCDAGAYTEKARYSKGMRMTAALRSLDDVFDFAPVGTMRMVRKAKRTKTTSRG